MHVLAESASDTFFVSRTGQPLTPNDVKKAMNRIAAQDGVSRLYAHLLRHTAATQYLVSGGMQFRCNRSSDTPA